MRTSSTPGFDLRDFDVMSAVESVREALQSGMRPPGRMGRGDIRTAILVALADEPMHGYQIIQAIEKRSGGTWKPSPGSIYPTLQLLADEGLLSSEQVGERKVYSLTDAGAEAAAQHPESEHPWRTRRMWDADRAALPKAGARLAQAVGQVATNGTREQNDRAAEIIDEARRKLYAILAED